VPAECKINLKSVVSRSLTFTAIKLGIKNKGTLAQAWFALRMELSEEVELQVFEEGFVERGAELSLAGF
jgi:hypothetical protein